MRREMEKSDGTTESKALPFPAPPVPASTNLPSSEMDAAQLAEDNILLLLADSNLPLGGFHFSAGLESSTKHGFVPLNTSAAGPSPLLPFLAASLRQHARSTLSFVSEAYALAANPNEDALDKLKKLDGLYESMTSNHITRRGSKIQGVGMLTIWQKALKRPAWLSSASEEEVARGQLVDALRQEVRDDRVVGHMPVCWGVLCGALGISHGQFSQNSPPLCVNSGKTLTPF